MNVCLLGVGYVYVCMCLREYEKAIKNYFINGVAWLYQTDDSQPDS